MKADKEFYDTLRAEISGGKNDVSTNLIMISKGRKPIEENDVDESKGLNNSKEILALKEKIGGLQSQIKMLEEQNSDLTRKNKSLEEELSSARTSITAENTSEESTTKANEIDTQVYVSIEEIAKWAFAQGEAVGGKFKEMIYDFDICLSSELKSSIKEHEKQYKQSSLPPNVGTVIMQQEIHNQVNGVNEGATGINVNKDAK